MKQQTNQSLMKGQEMRQNFFNFQMHHKTEKKFHGPPTVPNGVIISKQKSIISMSQ